MDNINNKQYSKKSTYSELAIAFKNTKSDKIFKILHDKMYPNLKNYIYNITKDMDAANDIASITMTKIYSLIDKYDPTYQITTWGYKMAFNDSIHFIRQRSKKTSLSNGYDISGDVDNSDMLSDNINTSKFSVHSIKDETVSDDEYLEEMKNQREKYLYTVHCIETLPDKYRNIMISRFLDNLSYRDIEINYNKPYINEYENIRKQTTEARRAGNNELFLTLKSKREKIKKKMLFEQSIKTRILKGRLLLKEKMFEKYNKLTL